MVGRQHKTKTAPEIVRDIPPLKQSQIKAAQSVRVVWHVTVPEGTDVSDVANPGYWVHVASQLTPGSRIEVYPEGFGWYADFLVVGKSTRGVDLHRLAFVELQESTEQDLGDGYTLRWAGVKKYQILDANRNVVGEDFENSDRARRFAANLEPKAA